MTKQNIRNRKINNRSRKDQLPYLDLLYDNYQTDYPVNKYGLGSAVNTAFKDAFSANGLKAIAGAGIGSLGSVVGNIGGGLISGGKSSAVGDAIGNIGGTIGGAIGAVNPVAGALVGAATGVVGGITNAMFGSKLNEERIAQAENEINTVKNFNADASNFDDLSQQIANSPVIVGFGKKDIGSDGWFSNKAKNKYRDLLAQKQFAEAWQRNSILNNATNLQQNQLDNLLQNYAAYGGLLDINNPYSDGGKIYIKPENRGKFTALKERTGKSATWFKEHGTPAQKKMATFALNAAKWHHAFGGDLLSNGVEWDNGITVINNGGLHSTNPYEGVQIGVDPQGIPNLVEEGEVIWNDYVFSNRIPVPNAVRSKYKLRGAKDMTFADAAKKVSKESEEMPNDNIAQRGLQDIMSKLAYEQEALREKRNMKRQNRQYAKGGILGNKGNLFFTGGPYEYGQNPLNMENYSDLSSLYKQGSDYMNKRQYIIDNWDSDYVKNWIKNTYVPYVQNYNKSRGYKSDFTVNLDQFTKGTYDNQYGGMHKGVLDFTIPETNRKKQSPTMNIYTTRGRKGGDISINPEALDIYGYSVPQDIIETTKDSEGNTINYLASLIDNNFKMSNKLKKENKGEDTPPPLTSRWFDETVLRYAPVVGSAIGLGQTLLSKPNYSRADALAQYAQNAGKVTPISYDPLGNYLTYRPNDVEYIANKMAAQAAATRRGIMNTSGGNRAFASAGLAAQDYSSQLAQAEAIRQADESNFNRGVQVETFNRGTNQYNSEAALKAAMANQEARLKASQLGLSGYSTAMQMKDAIDAQRNASISANLTNLFDSLGNIGIDAYNRKDRDMLLRAGVFGTLGEKPQGWSEKRWTDYKKALNGTGYRNGGKLKKKRGGFTY